jgi:hypothetical protein
MNSKKILRDYKNYLESMTREEFKQTLIDAGLEVFDAELGKGGVIYKEPCEHFPSPYIGYNYETHRWYCPICNVEIEDKEIN